MKIEVIADTHLVKNSEELQNFLENNFQMVDMIVHCGDFKTLKILEVLRNFKKTVAVYGNNDGEDLRAVLKEKEIFSVEGYRIGVIHGHQGIGQLTVDRAYNSFKDEAVDLVIFGHSHQPLFTGRFGQMMLNPGTLLRKRKERWYSYAVIDLGEKIQVSFRLSEQK